MLKDLGTRFDLGRSISALSVPATIQDSLMARLDSLGDAKRTLQIAAVIGRSFSVGMVSALTDTAKEESLRAFNRLEVSGLLIKSGSGGYRFKHAMIRDAAYDSLLRTERQALHQQIARLLEEGGPSDDPGQIALLAYHYSQAGQRERAIPHWLHAGVTALRYSSHREAIAHFREGIEFLRSQAPTPARQRQEIEFQINLAHAYTAIEGWVGARVEKAYRRARDLAERYGSLRQQLLVSWGLWVARLVASDLRKSRELADHLLALASASGDRPTELMANCAALVSHFFLGNLRTARAHAEKVCEQYDLRSDGRLVWTFQHDPKVVALVYLGHLHWLLGQPREARAAARQARKHAEKLGHPFMLSFALILGASDYLYERDLHRHMACVQRGVALADERGLSMFKVFGPLWASEAIVSRDPREATLEELSALLDSLLGRKMHLQAPVYQALLATQYSRMGNEARAKKLTRSALTLLKRTGEKWFEPELCRIMGEIEVARVRPNYKAAEGHFKRALALSRRMGAVGWEVRAVRSFADLRLRQGKIGGARRMVESVSKRYPPGQSCADLRECQPYLNAATTGAVADPSAMNA
jgi:predicted ATPase